LSFIEHDLQVIIRTVERIRPSSFADILSLTQGITESFQQLFQRGSPFGEYTFDVFCIISKLFIWLWINAIFDSQKQVNDCNSMTMELTYCTGTL